MRAVFLLLFLLATSPAFAEWQLSAGLGFHSNTFDKEPWVAQNPIGIVRATYEFKSVPITVGLEHQSMLRERESDVDGYGLNMATVLLNF